jgi:methyltransferase-like protein/cyclopropane fatty-acyl-phospholipid synthase-like methyltransferase
MSSSTTSAPAAPSAAARATGAATYDLIPYPAASFPQTHPNRLAGLAKVFGVDSPLPSSARVLELGCADGSNLLPMAAGLPGATFLGIDYSAKQSETGRQMLAASGLKNIELRHQSILDFPLTEGKFDYIIVHGIFSWVPEPVREKILAICSACLTDRGVAYISYNALPGWNMRKSIRDMMLFHTAGLTDPVARVRQARALLKFLSDSVPTERNAYGLLLKNELESISKAADNYLLHDHMEEENTAFYFHQFVGRAATHGLQYLGESSLSPMIAANFPESISKTLGQLGQVIAQEQYMDFLRNRMFRQTLLCKAGVAVHRNISPDRLRDCAFQSLLTPPKDPVDLSPGVSMTCQTANGQQVGATDSFLKAAFTVLLEANTSAIAFPDLLAAASAKAKPFIPNPPRGQAQIEEATLLKNLLNLYSRGLIEAHREPVRCSLTVPERPAIPVVARLQARTGRSLTNRLHQPIPADGIGRAVAIACDGTRTADQIIEQMVAEAKAGALTVQVESRPVTDDQQLRNILSAQVRGALVSIARGGFFAP